MVAVVSDGTRVLGLGDIGAAAALPVMEGKSLLFKKFGDVDCIPLVVDTKDADTLINTVKLLQKTLLASTWKTFLLLNATKSKIV